MRIERVEDWMLQDLIEDVLYYQTGIDEDIKAMPMGMHTIISEGSGGVSGGQRQRLLIFSKIDC